jgi:hypothetical protein
MTLPRQGTRQVQRAAMITSRKKSVWAFIATFAAFFVAFRVSQYDGGLSRAQAGLAMGLGFGLPLASIVMAVLDVLEVRRSRAKHLGSGLTARPASYALPILAIVLAASFLVPFGRFFILEATGGRATTGTPAVSASASPSWTNFTSPAGDFSVLFPGIPKERTETLERPGGPMPVYVAGVNLSPTEFYGVASGKDTTEHVGESAGSILDRLEADYLTRSNGRLLSRADVYTGTVLGRELEVETPEMRVRARLFVTRQTIYQVLVFHALSQKSTDDHARFLDSFTIRATE